jgi:exodeoxyribonuclease V gamma subunit
VTIGKGSGGGQRSTLGPVDPAGARVLLGELVDLYDRGMREPPPLASDASAAYAAAARAGRDPIAAGRGAWESPYNFDREDKDPAHQLVLGGVLTFAELIDAPARTDESGPWWDASETRRFGRWSRRLWDGLLAVEQVVDR